MTNSFSTLLNSVADRGLELLALRSGRHGTQDLEAICASLMSQRGEASGVALAREVAQRYRALDRDGRLAFLRHLATRYGPDRAEVERCIDAYRATPEDDTRLMELLRAVEPPRQEMFRRINMAPEGVATVIAMRSDLLGFLPEAPELAPVDADLRHLLASWFNRGFLVLERIDWRTPAVILEKLIQYEAVHEIPDWRHLRRRLAEDRRCFAFFHPALKDEPIIFVQVALVQGLAGEVQPLLDPDGPVADPEAADTAVFYSITNCQTGLRGISFGNFLLKQVVSDLQREWPNLKQFATLSPIPGLRAWAEEVLAQRDSGIAESDPEVPAELLDAAARAAELPHPPEGRHALPRNQERRLMQLCAHYLVRERRCGRPRDPVAKFHLGNGARVERINWLGDTSEKGWQQSFGMLVNYAYRPGELETNHEAYVNAGKIATSKAVDALLKT